MERPVQAPAGVKETEVKTTTHFLDNIEPSSNVGATEVKTRTQFSNLPYERRTGFFNLPFELRLQIYRLSLPTKFMFEAREYNTCFGFLGCNRYGGPLGTYFRSQCRKFEPYLEHSEGEDPNAGVPGSDEENHGQDPYNCGSADSNWPLAVYRPDRVKHILAFLSVSRQLREEVLDVLYGENLFMLDPFQTQHVGTHTIPHPLSTATAGQMQRMRHIMLVPGRFSWTVERADFKTVNFYAALRDTTFPCLKTLCIVFNQAEGIPQWNWKYEYMPTLLMYLRRKLPASVRVYVDANGYGPAVEAFERMLLVPQGFQEIETRFGDRHYFKNWQDGVLALRPRSLIEEQADQRQIRELLKREDPFDPAVSRPS